jgi:hypothetical protein
MSQSGEGMSLVTNETIEKLLLTKSRDSILSSGFSSLGIVNSSNTSSLNSLSNALTEAVEQNSEELKN